MILSLVSKKKVEDYLAALESGPACGEGFRSAWTAILIITDIESEAKQSPGKRGDCFAKERLAVTPVQRVIARRCSPAEAISLQTSRLLRKNYSRQQI